jgi:hypothetical protein
VNWGTFTRDLCIRRFSFIRQARLPAEPVFFVRCAKTAGSRSDASRRRRRVYEVADLKCFPSLQWRLQLEGLRLVGHEYCIETIGR